MPAVSAGVSSTMIFAIKYPISAVMLNTCVDPWVTATAPEGAMLPPFPAKVLMVYVLRVNVAVTLFAVSIVTVQLPVPVHAPDHPVKREPWPGDAERVTVAAARYISEQSEPQEMPAGEEFTEPDPVPFMLTVSEFVEGSGRGCGGTGPVIVLLISFEYLLSL